jgi:dephospho-CoA kinase
MPIDDKVARATYVIDNGGSLAATRAQTEAVWKQIAG